MVRHILTVLPQILQNFQSVSDHFTTLRNKGLNAIKVIMISIRSFTGKPFWVYNSKYINEFISLETCSSIFNLFNSIFDVLRVSKNKAFLLSIFDCVKVYQLLSNLREYISHILKTFVWHSLSGLVMSLSKMLVKHDH